MLPAAHPADLEYQLKSVTLRPLLSRYLGPVVAPSCKRLVSKRFGPTETVPHARGNKHAVMVPMEAPWPQSSATETNVSGCVENGLRNVFCVAQTVVHRCP